MYHPSVIAHSQERLEKALGMPLREYNDTEVMDYAYRLKDVEWEGEEPISAIIASQPEDVQLYIFNELQRSKIDFRYWCSRYAKITDDRGKLSALKPWPSQMALLDKLAEIEREEWDYFTAHPKLSEFECKMMMVLLKSRQIGGTVISEALAAHLTVFFPHTRTVIGSDHPDNSLKLFRVLTGIIDNLPGWMKPRADARVKATNLHFPDLDSDVVVGSGNQKTTLGQGMTVDVAHLTELSTWKPENALALDYDLRPAFASSRKHHSLLILESTGAGGKGNWFHDQYQLAATGQSEFKNLFVGWFMCPDKFARRADGVEFNDVTKGIAARVLQESGIELSREQMSWYQFKRNEAEAGGKLEIFLQEHPSFAEEAFQMGLRSVFTLEERSKVRSQCRTPAAVYEVNLSTQKLRPVDLERYIKDQTPNKADNKLVIWEENKPGYVYVVGVDASYGQDGGDSSAIEVVRVGNRWTPDEQVAEWRGTIPPSQLHIPAWIVGNVYTDREMGLPAKMAVECNPGSPGIVCQTDLMRRGYTHFYIYSRPLRQDGKFSQEVGWWTTPATRPVLTEKGVEAIRKGDLRVNSPGVVEEMGSYVVAMMPNGRRELTHADGYHDDRLMALFIAYYVAHEHDTVMIADERRRAYEQRFKGVTAPPREFNTMGISWEQAMERWENDVLGA